MNTGMSSILWSKLRQSRSYRRAFLRAQFKRIIPFQIGGLRRDRGWSQEKLAEASNLTQGVISRAEDQDYGNLTVNTILSIADGFDVAFIGKFVPYGELEEWLDSLSNKIRVPSFDEEDKQRLRKEIVFFSSDGNKASGTNGQTRQGSNSIISIERAALEGKGQQAAAS